jgi:glycosyltransferase involved in cell wall biosynthesis
MRIIIASGIFEPEGGGPATYAPKLAALLVEKGWDVTVLTYSDRERYETDSAYPFKLIRVVRSGKILNRIKFFFAVLKYAHGSDLIYSFDWFAAGVPLAAAAKLMGTKYVLRIGGDYAWEQKYLESGAPPVSLRDFYERGLYLFQGYRMLFRLIRWTLQNAASVVFNSDIQRDLYVRFYGLPSGKTSVIYNPVPRMELKGVVRTAANHEFVFWGRFNKMKNVDSLVRAFAKARIPDSYTLLLIGEGPRKKLIEALVRSLGIEKRVVMIAETRFPYIVERVKNCRAFIQPSWTDVSPNQVYEALAIGLPALVTKQTYLPIRDRLPSMIDPSSVDDIAAKLEMLSDDTQYEKFSREFNSVTYDHDWDAVAAQHVALFQKLVRV